MTIFTPAEPVCFISTHLDDVALSCSHFLAAHPGMNVVTVFTDGPSKIIPTGWNAETTGQQNAREAQRSRRFEDMAGMALVQARPQWLSLWESEYTAANPRPREPIVDALRPELRKLGAASVVIPLGLKHSDHIAVSDACLALAAESNLDWYIYADLPYAVAWPHLVAPRLAEVSQWRPVGDLRPFNPTNAIKHDVLSCYPTQYKRLRADLGDRTMDTSNSEPERYWRLNPPAARGRVIATSV